MRDTMTNAPELTPPHAQRYRSRHAIVTGGASGIGAAIVRRLASEGARVTVLDLDVEAGEAIARVANGRFVRCDVGSLASVTEALATDDPLDVLVNSAGIAHVGTVASTSPADIDRLVRVNIKGTYHTMHVAVPRMVARGHGTILNIASIASKIGVEDRFAYSMTKGAVMAMTLSVARDFVTRGIRCNCVCPARVHTPFVDGFLAANYPDRVPEMFGKLSAYQPIGRMADPHEVAALAAYLCSDEASFVTGSAYDIDGGVTLLR